MNEELKKKASSILEGSVFNFTIGNYKVITDYILMAPFTPGFQYTKHQHSFYEFHYIYGGKGKVGIEDKEFNLEKGDFYVTSPNVVHWQVASKTDPMIEYCIRYQIDRLSGDELEEEIHEEGSDMDQLVYCLDYHTKQVVKDQHNLEGCFHRLFSEVLNKQLGYHQMMVNEIENLLYQAARNFSTKNSPYEMDKGTINCIRLNRLSTYIYDNIHLKLTYEDVAKQMSMSERHLSRIVNEEKGMTLYQLILDLKMKKVTYYLENTPMKLKDIAEMTGFCSEYHLSRAVKKYVGKNPSELRKSV